MRAPYPSAGITSDAERWLAAAQALVEARGSKSGLEALPESLRPHDNEAAWQIQTRVTHLLVAQGDAVAGWKCATPLDGKLVVAPIYRSLLSRTSRGDAMPMASRGAWVDIEPELAVILKCDLPPRGRVYEPRDIAACIGAVHPALEIIGSRYATPATRSFPELLADGLFNEGLVLADSIHVDVQTPPAHLTLSIEVGGDVTRHEGAHPEGDVLRPLCWLSNFLCEHGLGLRSGEAVITGSYAGVLRIPTGRSTRITFGDLGTMSVRFDSGRP